MANSAFSEKQMDRLVEAVGSMTQVLKSNHNLDPIHEIATLLQLYRSLSGSGGFGRFIPGEGLHTEHGGHAPKVEDEEFAKEAAIVKRRIEKLVATWDK